METVLKAIVRYDGGNFAGWQRQPGRRTVQGVLEDVLSRIANRPVAIQGAGRTDAGVHALGQVFSCVWPGPLPPRLRHAVSQLAGPDLRVISMEEASPEFNARFAAVSKRYEYVFACAKEPDPFSARYAWQVPHTVDRERLAALLPRIEGVHDFAGFQSAGSPRPTTVRTLFRARLEPGALAGPADAEGHWRIVFEGDGFLYKMVRNLSGTLVEIARGRYSESFLEERLSSPGPFTGFCAPAHGLFLVSVEYLKSANAPHDPV